MKTRGNVEEHGRQGKGGFGEQTPNLNYVLKRYLKTHFISIHTHIELCYICSNAPFLRQGCQIEDSTPSTGYHLSSCWSAVLENLSPSNNVKHCPLLLFAHQRIIGEILLLNILSQDLNKLSWYWHGSFIAMFSKRAIRPTKEEYSPVLWSRCELCEQ